MTKKIIAILALSIGVFGAHQSAAYAQVPVIDPTAINTSIVHQAQTMTQWAQQLQGMMNQLQSLQNQYQTLQNTYDSMTGSRGMGQILNNPALNDYYPKGWQQTYQTLQQTGTGLTATAQSLYNASKIFDRCGQTTDPTGKILCLAQSQKAAQDLDFANNALNVNAQRLQQITSLMGQINATSDLKGAQEMTARMGAEQNNLQAVDSKLKTQMYIAQQNDQVLTEQSRQYLALGASRTNGIPSTIVGWGQ